MAGEVGYKKPPAGWNKGLTKGRVDEDGRECSLCGDYKLWKEFSPCTYARTGHLSACRVCRNARGQDVRDNQDSQERRAARFASGRAQTYRKFGITAEDYGWLTAKQDGLCALCFRPETHQHPRWTTVVSLAIDHDHSCPEHASERGCVKCIRGLLCRDCNMLLGLVEKSGCEALTARFFDYLQQRPLLGAERRW